MPRVGQSVSSAVCVELVGVAVGGVPPSEAGSLSKPVKLEDFQVKLLDNFDVPLPITSLYGG
jgi:hypothetical protein